MDSNSTLVPNPRERCCVKEDSFAMATYNDNQSESNVPYLPPCKNGIYFTTA